MTVAEIVPRPGRIPSRRDTVDNLSKRQRDLRKAVGPKTRLTTKVHEAIVGAVRLGTPLGIAYEQAGISRGTVRKWIAIADQAAKKRWDERDQMERRCVVFTEALRQASAEAGMRVHATIAQAAGLTTQRPKAVITRRRMRGGHYDPETGRVEGGEIIEAMVEEREALPDWRAAALIGRYRWPDEMGALPIDEPGAVEGSEVTPAMLYDKIMQIRRERAEAATRMAGEVDAHVIDARVVENAEDEEPPDPDAKR